MSSPTEDKKWRPVRTEPQFLDYAFEASPMGRLPIRPSEDAIKFLDQSQHYYLMSRKRVLPVCQEDSEVEPDGRRVGSSDQDSGRQD